MEQQQQQQWQQQQQGDKDFYLQEYAAYHLHLLKICRLMKYQRPCSKWQQLERSRESPCVVSMCSRL
jgi:hypothetical protein